MYGFFYGGVDGSQQELNVKEEQALQEVTLCPYWCSWKEQAGFGSLLARFL